MSAKDLSILIQPFMPDISKEIQHKLQVKNQTWNDLGKLSIKPGAKIIQGKPLFEKMTDDQVIKLHDKFAGNKPHEETPFDKLNLKVAEVIDVKQHPDANKLYIMQLNLGKEKRQIVSGIKEWFTINELEGKKIVIVTNLEPVNLRGEKSNGMLLAAQFEKDLKLLEAPNSKPGDSVFIEGSKQGKKVIPFNEFKKVKFKIRSKEIIVNEKPLKSKTEVLKINISDDAKVS